MYINISGAYRQTFCVISNYLIVIHLGLRNFLLKGFNMATSSAETSTEWRVLFFSRLMVLLCFSVTGGTSFICFLGKVSGKVSKLLDDRLWKRQPLIRIRMIKLTIIAAQTVQWLVVKLNKTSEFHQTRPILMNICN